MPLDDETEAQAIPLRHRTTTLGSNPDRVQALIIGEEVQAIHALIQIKEKKFWIQDLNSHSGTWVNYRIIGTENVQIYPGDLIHFGSTGFRFTIKEDKHQHVTVSKYELYP
jgi:pSer/pThr/pTyr-binding forkhead associated (FHA) protein